MRTKLKRKCNHDATDDTLTIYEARKYGTYTILQKAALNSFCNECENEENYYVAGGILYADAEGNN